MKIPTRVSATWLGRTWRALPLALAFSLGSAWPVFGQLGAGQLAVRSDGFVFWIAGGQKHVVYPARLSDEQINTIPEGAPLNAALQADSAPVVQQRPALPNEESRAQYLAFGETCQCVLIRGTGQRSDLQIRLTEVRRNAWDLLRSTNPANQPPRAGFEYVMVTLDVNYVNGPPDLPLSLDRWDFSMVDANDALYTPAFVVEPQPLTATTAFPGTRIIASIAFQVPSGDRDLSLVWRYHDEYPAWFAVP